jgi:16S rRNA (adenine(1408)-N(1))-methyltransferase
VAALSDNSIETPLNNLSRLTGEGVIIDIGTGDGRFVYQSARQNPNKFYIGIDPNVRPLEKISEKIHRKPAKGGASNVLFIQAAVEELPQELDGVADEVHVHFPWGSLLRAFASGDVEVLRNVRRICSPGAMLEVVINDHIADQLIQRYRSAGFEVLEHGSVPAAQWSEFETTWARRLKQNEHRSVFYLIARAV